MWFLNLRKEFKLKMFEGLMHVQENLYTDLTCHWTDSHLSDRSIRMFPSDHHISLLLLVINS